MANQRMVWAVFLAASVAAAGIAAAFVDGVHGYTYHHFARYGPDVPWMLSIIRSGRHLAFLVPSAILALGIVGLWRQWGVLLAVLVSSGWLFALAYVALSVAFMARYLFETGILPPYA